MREDTKAVPAEEVNKKATERVAEIKESFGRIVGKKELREIKDQVLLDLLPRAFTKTRRTHVLFSERTSCVYVNTGSQKVADLVMTLLVHSLISVKTSTVHVSEPKMGLTARLKNWLNEEEDSFGSFEPVSEVVLKDADRKWAIKADNLRNTQDALREAIEKSASVSSIGFMNEEGVFFRITDALRIKGVKHTVVEDDEDTDVHHCYLSQLASEIATLDDIMDELLELLSPEKAQAPKADEPYSGHLEDLF